ncbi:MAG TPA: BatA domain-containing protein, partial [Gemmatimonadaceae bacterium]|nr:BatA domain-containing protein [Gemmatimonadaceae bacterium]
MGFSFLTPAFLVGLAALAVPVLVHLIHRERKETVPFPSLMFLHQIPFKSVRRQKIRHWLLFALRCLALALLVLAFARPFLQSREARAIATGTGAREVVILVDRSYSMGYGDRWQRALEAARRTIDGLGSDDRATMVFFADRAQAVTEATSDRATLHAAIGDARPGSGRTRYAPALRLAQQIAANSELPRREVVLITDFQKVAWDGSDEISLPAGTTLTRVNLAGGDVSNLTVTGVELHRDFPEGRERVTATARLAARGATAFRDAPVTFTLNGRALETRNVTVEPNGSATVTFAPIALPEGHSRGTIHAGGDALPADNAFHFVLSRGQALSVLV